MTDKEKVKAIKNALEEHPIRKIAYQDGIKIKEIYFFDILTCINELESENENCHEVLADLKTIIKQQNDRIAELEEQRDRQAYIAEDLIQEKHRWTEQARKETAKEILEWLKQHTFDSCFGIIEVYFKETFGVKVEG